MEIAEQQELHANTKSNGNGKGGGGVAEGKFLKDDEEKVWLDEAYEEAVKREVEYQYLYDAHSLGGAW
jgi:phosphatidylserine/phosphatidylglycerophosphate/cardiolipin synthase-like enzyme